MIDTKNKTLIGLYNAARELRSPCAVTNPTDRQLKALIQLLEIAVGQYRDEATYRIDDVIDETNAADWAADYCLLVEFITELLRRQRHDYRSHMNRYLNGWAGSRKPRVTWQPTLHKLGCVLGCLDRYSYALIIVKSCADRPKKGKS